MDYFCGSSGSVGPGIDDRVHDGWIDVLFVAVGVEVWGRFDPEKDKVYVHEPPEPGDEDLLDLTVIQTLINGGMVYAVLPEEVSDRALLAAIMRY